jgi:hypothetical protein
MFGGGSNSVHGNWQEIAGNHLEWDEEIDRFQPSMQWRRPRPQVLLAVGRLTTSTLPLYFSFMAGDEASKPIKESLSDLLDRFDLLSEAHEYYLIGKKWPDI